MTHSPVSEANLITKAQKGNRDAYGELVQLHAKALMRMVYHLCGDVQLAEDVTQEAFLKAWQHLPSYKPEASLRSWLYRIAVNTALDKLRRTPQVDPLAVEDIPLADSQPNPEATLLRKERTELVQKAVLSLPPASRSVLVLREYEGLSYRQIADTLDIPLGTVMSRLNYARQYLKEKLQSELIAAEVEYA